MTTLTAYRSELRTGRDGFAQLLRAEWTKFRTVRGWLIGMAVAALLVVGIGALTGARSNVGLPVVLGEWDAGIVTELARRHGLSWGAREVDRLMGLIGGHPHLVRLVLYHVAAGANLDAALATGATDEGLFADHLRHLLWQVQGQPALREAVARVMEAEGAVRLDTEVAFKLVSLGFGELQGNEVRVAKELYRRYFTGRLLPA